MLLPFTIKNVNADGDSFTEEYLNPERIISLVEIDDQEISIKYDEGNNVIRHFITVAIPESLSLDDGDESTCLKIFQGENILNIEESFTRWSKTIYNLKVISMSSCIDHNCEITIMILYRGY